MNLKARAKELILLGQKCELSKDQKLEFLSLYALIATREGGPVDQQFDVELFQWIDFILWNTDLMNDFGVYPEGNQIGIAGITVR